MKKVSQTSKSSGNFHIPHPKAGLEFTGERLTSSVGGQIEIEHYHRYCLARDICVDLDVLDVASGEGYGSAMLAQTARSVSGVEIDAASVKHAQSSYTADNLAFIQGDALNLPVPDASVDAVVSFETLEHVFDLEKFLSEIRRVLRPGGVLIVSTPERSVYSSVERQPNKYHVLELNRVDFEALLRANFTYSVVMAQRPLLGSLLALETEPGWRSYERRSAEIIEVSSGLSRPEYLVGIASDTELTGLFSSLYIDRTPIHQALEGVRQLPELKGRVAELERHLPEARRQVSDLERQLPEAQWQVSEIMRERDDYAAHATRLSVDLDRERLVASDAHHNLKAISDTNEELRRELQSAEHLLVAMNATGARLAHDLTKAYSKPWRPARKSLERAALRFILLARPALPARTVERLKSSLAKRKANYFTHTWQSVSGAAAQASPLEVSSRHRANLRQKLHVGGLRLAATVVAPFSETKSIDFHNSADKRALNTMDIVARTDARPTHLKPPHLPVHINGSENPEVSIIIPTYGQVDYTINCVASLARNPPRRPFEVIVMDDAYPKEDVKKLGRHLKGVRIIRNSVNKGFLLTCNAAAAECKGKYLFFLNNDTELLPNSIDVLADALDADATVGMTGSRLLYPDGSLQEAGGIIWSDGSGWNFGRNGDPKLPEYNYRREVDYISGAAIMVRASLFAELGGFDPAYAPAYCEDSDLAFRIRERGLSVVLEPRSDVIHFEGKSHGTDVSGGVKSYQVKNTERLRTRWKDILQRDHMSGPHEILRARDRARHRKVILVIDHYVPEPDRDAGSRTIWSFLQELCASGWVVKFWPDNRAYSPTYTAPLQDLGIEVLDGRWPGSFADWISLNGHALDHVLVSRPTVAVNYIDTLARGTRARLSFYGHDLHFLRMRRQADAKGDAALLREATLMERYEKSLWQRFDNIIYPSSVETDIVKANAPLLRARTVVPYSFQNFVKRETPSAGRTLLFVAGFAHEPNVAAAEYLVRKIMPRVWAQDENVRLKLVGSHPTDAVKALAGNAVEVTGWVSDEALNDYYNSARLVVVPLLFGSGIKSKVVEAMSKGVPLVATTIAAEGLPGVDVVFPVHDEADAFAQSILRLLCDDAYWQEVSTASTAYAEAHFSGAALRASLLDALDASA